MNRTCCRCGQGFESGPQTRYICQSCRKPRGHVPNLMGKQLTNREKQVCKLLVLPNKLIAYELKLSEGTIKEYLNRIFQKTGCSNRTGLAIHFANRLLSPKPVPLP